MMSSSKQFRTFGMAKYSLIEIGMQNELWTFDRLQVAALDLVTAVNCATTSLLFFTALRADTLNL